MGETTEAGVVDVRIVEPIRKLYTFRVSGQGMFPIDMLRYDSCWPSRESPDSYEVTRALTFGYREPWEIELVGIRRPTVERWASFGTKVISWR